MKFSKLHFTLLITLLISLTGTTLKAQAMLRDVTGKTLQQRSIQNMVGSTLLIDEWSKGVIKFTDNTNSNTTEIKYDQLEDIVLFKNDKGEVLVVSDPIKEFKIYLIKNGTAQEKIFRAGFNSAKENSDKAFYEIIADNQIKFVKRTVKTIVEETEYNAASPTKKVTDKVSYFIVKSNTPIPVSKSEKSILNAIGEKQAELAAYIKTNHLNLKNDTDIEKLLTYYDGLI